MKRKVLPLFLAVLMLCTLAVGCSRKNNNDDVNGDQNQEQNGQNNGDTNNNGNDNDNNENLAEITVERISGFLGRTRDDLASLFTGNATVSDDGEMYQQKIYGTDARVRAEYDDDDKIERFYVYTDETGFTNNFRTELDKLYGTFDEETGWQSEDFSVRVERENGEVVLILERAESGTGNDTGNGTGNGTSGNGTGSGNTSGTAGQ